MLSRFIIIATIVALGFPTDGIACVYSGKDFLLIMPQIYPYNPSRNFTLSIHGPPNTSVAIQGPWDTVREVIGGETFINFTSVHHTQLNAVFDDGEAIKNISFRITSTSSVVAYVHVEHGDGYTGIPKPPPTKATYTFVTASYSVRDGCRSYVAVAAFETKTTVQVRVRVQNTGVARIGNQEFANKQRFSVSIDSEEVLFIWSSEDLTGTYIRGDKPVSVFSGADCACITVGRNKCQGMMEQFLPVVNLGLKPLPVHVSMFGRSHNLTARAVAARASTMFSVHGVEDEITLEAVGDYSEWKVTLSSGRNTVSNKAVLIVHYLQADLEFWPSMNFVVPSKGFKKYYRIAAMVDFESTVIIVHPVKASGDYFIIANDIQMHISNVYKLNHGFVALKTEINPGAYNIRSSDDSAKIMIYVYGYGKSSSHSFVGACAVDESQVSTSVMTSTKEISSRVPESNTDSRSTRAVISPSSIAYISNQKEAMFTLTENGAVSNSCSQCKGTMIQPSTSLALSNSIIDILPTSIFIYSSHIPTGNLISVHPTVPGDHSSDTPNLPINVSPLDISITTSSEVLKRYSWLETDINMKRTLARSDASDTIKVLSPDTMQSTTLDNSEVSFDKDTDDAIAPEDPLLRLSFPSIVETSVSEDTIYASTVNVISKTSFNEDSLVRFFTEPSIESRTVANAATHSITPRNSIDPVTEIISPLNDETKYLGYGITESFSAENLMVTQGMLQTSESRTEMGIRPTSSSVDSRSRISPQNDETKYLGYGITESISAENLMVTQGMLQTSESRTEMGNSPTSSSVDSSSRRNHQMSSVQSLCPCSGRNSCDRLLVTRIEARKSQLRLNTKTLALQVQKKQSSKDARVSSKTFGIIGILVVVLPMVTIFMTDMKVLLRNIMKG